MHPVRKDRVRSSCRTRPGPVTPWSRPAAQAGPTLLGSKTRLQGHPHLRQRKTPWSDLCGTGSCGSDPCGAKTLPVHDTFGRGPPPAPRIPCPPGHVSGAQDTGGKDACGTPSLLCSRPYFFGRRRKLCFHGASRISYNGAGGGDTRGIALPFPVVSLKK